MPPQAHLSAEVRHAAAAFMLSVGTKNRPDSETTDQAAPDEAKEDAE